MAFENYGFCNGSCGGMGFRMTLEKICRHRSPHQLWCEKAKALAFTQYCESVCKFYEPSETEFLESYRGTAGMCLDSEGEF